MNDSIAIFDKNLALAVFVVIESNKLKITYYNDGIKKQLEAFLQSAASQLLKAKFASKDFDGTTHFGFIRVGITDPRFGEALSFELQLRGFYSSRVISSIQYLLLLLSGKGIQFSEREEILGDILNLPNEDITVLTQNVKSLSGTVNDIITNRQKHFQ